jgi:hypothetical protein
MLIHSHLLLRPPKLRISLPARRHLLQTPNLLQPHQMQPRLRTHREWKMRLKFWLDRWLSRMLGMQQGRQRPPEPPKDLLVLLIPLFYPPSVPQHLLQPQQPSQQLPCSYLRLQLRLGLNLQGSRWSHIRSTSQLLHQTSLVGCMSATTQTGGQG